MKQARNAWISVLFIAATVGSATADVTIGDTTVVFANKDEAVTLLTEKDDFISALGDFDRAARLKTDKPVSEKVFLDSLSKAATAWPAAEKAKVQTALEALAPKLAIMGIPLPKKISVVRTTGAEEGHAAYTRGAAIFLPPEELARNPGILQGTIAHEFFHIISRHNPELREKAYAAIGFIKCNEVPLPGAMMARKITNPDAPKNDHYIRLNAGDTPILALPVLVSITDKYDTKKGGEFLDYMAFRWLVVEAGPDGTIRPQPKGSDLQLLDMREVGGFYDQVGRNTNYTIHPEEILAENFKLMLIGAQGGASPEVSDRIRAALLGGPASRPATAPSINLPK